MKIHQFHSLNAQAANMASASIWRKWHAVAMSMGNSQNSWIGTGNNHANLKIQNQTITRA